MSFFEGDRSVSKIEKSRSVSLAEVGRIVSLTEVGSAFKQKCQGILVSCMKYLLVRAVGDAASNPESPTDNDHDCFRTTLVQG